MTMTSPSEGNDVQSRQGPNQENSSSVASEPLRGWRLVVILCSFAFGLLLAVIETSITATALVSIGNYFGDPIKVTWVVLAYLLSYMGFAMIFTRMSDGIGRLEATIIAWIFFGAFSLGSGLAKTLNQLIGFRLLQGIGGSGLYSMVMVVGTEITPIKHYGSFSAMIGMTVAVGSILGPILGGVITTESTWRWIYLFNAPCTAFGIFSLLVCWPRPKSNSEIAKNPLRSFHKVDYLGAILLLAASTLLVFALQEAGAAAYAWNSAAIISALAISAVCWCAFFGWISWLSFGEGPRGMRAIFPLTIALTRPTGPAIVAIFLTGFPYLISIINLPQRFQIVNGATPLMAGVHLLPLLCSMALGGGVGGAVSTRKNLTSHTLIFATCLILLGCGLMSTVSDTLTLNKAIYGYQFILGLGTGLTFSSVTMMANLANKPENIAAAQGAISQARIFGGSIGLSIATIVLNHKINTELAGILTPFQLHNLEQSLTTIAELSPSDRAAVTRVYAASFGTQMRICTYLSAAGVIAATGTYLSEPPKISAPMEPVHVDTEMVRY
ncbi:putative MFS multidrug transporter [Talaromyces proteolyticus]|uniref:MFS multidrug transporter n=1 Tax=Talaromyces proteolyticus TaxID=1131652 RepID=A0AAD4KKE7_9EURO|nr:putative MFS multidrug transporter [Talaromyces proteolyticus]KAH8692258.1 putative MFS multidrug transporter [Talaromyces proteolyticus]